MPMRVRLAGLPRCSWTDKVTGAGRRRYEVGSHNTRAKYGMEAMDQGCVCTYIQARVRVQYKHGSLELSRSRSECTSTWKAKLFPYSVPCLALVEVRGNGSLRRRGCFLGLRAPVPCGTAPEVPPGAVGKKEKRAGEWLMSEG